MADSERALSPLTIFLVFPALPPCKVPSEPYQTGSLFASSSSPSEINSTRSSAMPYTPPVINSDDDDGSLFGSPPQSPSRGRSPSTLALPSGAAQNVGTLALPGSHPVAELPVTPPAFLSLSASAHAPSPASRPHAQPGASVIRSRPPPSQLGVALSSRNSTGPGHPPHTEPAQRKTRKGKQKAQSSTPRPTPPPIPLPLPDESVPPNFLRNQQALLGVAGMVGGVNPANLSKARQARGNTAENPIIVEEEPMLPSQPSIGKRPTRQSPSDPSQLPRPTSEQILGTLLQQKNIYPVVVSLLRLLMPGAPSLASIPPNYPSSSYSYAPSYPAVQTRSQSPETSSTSSHFTGVSAPPLKRRKLNSVPAGAADWDVPYPFEEGQGPENYRTNWERERGKQLLADLVQLVRGAAQKAATKAWYQQQQQQQMQQRLLHGQAYPYGPGGYGHYLSPALKYYRPATLSYGLERPAAQVLATQSQREVTTTQRPGSTTPSSIATPECEGASPYSPTNWQPAPSISIPGVSGVSSSTFDHLVQSLLVAQQQQEACEGSNVSASTHAADTSTSAPISDGNTQAFFDSWLEMLTTFPPGDPNDAMDSVLPAHVATTSTSSSDCPAPTHSSNSDHRLPTSETAVMVETSASPNTYDSSQVLDSMIDPVLLCLSSGSPASSISPSGMTVAASSGGNAEQLISASSLELLPRVGDADAGPAVSVSSPAVPTGLSHDQPQLQAHGLNTPSLVDSPSITATSLTDSADAGPTTPSWDWAFPDLQDASTVEGMKLLDELAAMDADVDVVMRELHAEADALSVAATCPPQTVTSNASSALEIPSGGQESTGSTVEQEDAPLHLQSDLARDDTPSSCTGVLGTSTPGEYSASTITTATSTPHLPPTAGPSFHPPSAVFPFAPESRTPSFPHTSPSPLPSSASNLVDVGVTPVRPNSKAKAKAIPGTGNGVSMGSSSSSKSGGKQGRKAILERARAMRAALQAEVERAKIALWETTLEQGVLVGLGKELEKDGG